MGCRAPLSAHTQQPAERRGVIVSNSSQHSRLLTTRAALILLLGVLAGAGAAVTVVLLGVSLAHGVLAGGAAFGGAVTLFHQIID